LLGERRKKIKLDSPTAGHRELLIRQRIQTLSRALPGAREGSVTSVHQARVATRRLREALPLVASGNVRRKLQRRVRRLTRALGVVRELDVVLLLLEEFANSGYASAASVQCLWRAIGDERQRVHADLLRSVERINVDKLARRAIAAAQARDAEPRATGERAAHARAAIDSRTALRAERLRAAIESAAGMYLPDRLHEVRIAIKKLRYALEIGVELQAARPGRTAAARARTRAAAAAIRALKRTQELLGRLHDLEVLIARTRGVQGSASAPNLRLSAELDQFVRRLEMDCRQLHGQYIAVRPTLLSICADAIAKPGRRRSAA
jgi:CHAD domain-containing protein